MWPLYSECFAPIKDSFQWGWDAWVAIGTLVLAGVTVAAIVVPLLVEWHHNKRTAARYAVLFDHELSVLFWQMVTRAQGTNEAMCTRPNIPTAFQTIYVSYALIGVPVLEKVVERLDVFPIPVALRLGVVLSTVIQIHKNPPPKELPAFPFDIAVKLVTGVHDESIALAVKTHDARASIRTVLGKFAVLDTLDDLPTDIRNEFNARKAADTAE